MVLTMVNLKKEILDALANGEGYPKGYDKIFEENSALLDELDNLINEQ